MPSRTKTTTAPAPVRERPAPTIDNYFDDDPFASDTDDEHSGDKNSRNNKRKEPDAGLGIDEEVQVKKRARAPRVKLDETR
jgi:replication fork protection complex subunit Csm3/Swi3